MRGKGEPGTNGGPRGDLLVQVLVSDSPVFARQDMDIYSAVSISYAQAALGSDVRIRTVDGDVMYTVKAGTQPGTRVRLRGKGVPSLRNQNVRGDHYVTLNVAVPQKMSEEAKRALKAFDALTGNSLGTPPEETGSGSGKAKKKGFFNKLKEGFEDTFEEKHHSGTGAIRFLFSAQEWFHLRD